MFFYHPLILYYYSLMIICFPNLQITILVAAEGGHKLPTINSSGDLKEALQKLGSIPSRRIQVRTINIVTAKVT